MKVDRYQAQENWQKTTMSDQMLERIQASAEKRARVSVNSGGNILHLNEVNEESAAHSSIKESVTNLNVRPMQTSEGSHPYISNTNRSQGQIQFA